jgi:hypothetical protein
MLTPADHARALSAIAREPRPATCAHCGRKFLARGRGRYCRTACRQLAWQMKQRRKRPSP